MLKQAKSLYRLSHVFKIRFWPCLASLVLTVVLLQVLHMALLSRLEEKEARIKDKKFTVTRQLQGRMFRSVVAEMNEKVRNSYRFDKSGTYYVVDNFLTSEHVMLGRSEFDVSLVTQSSSSHLYNLVELSHRWNGPISVSVFTYDDDFVTTVSTLLYFHFCNDYIYRFVSFHLVYPITRAPKYFDRTSDLKLSCSDNIGQSHIKTQRSTQGSNYADKTLEYPNNLLRNLAINYAQTPYIFMIDIDFLPSENLRIEFQRLMSSASNSVHSTNASGSRDSSGHQQRSMSAYVVPAFEIQESVTVPGQKADLMKLWLTGVVRPFYWELCQSCQRQTNYELWRGLGSGGPVRIAYTVERDGIWEPFYIARTSLPLYDERFRQYGYNRISQVWHAIFHISFNIFLS